MFFISKLCQSFCDYRGNCLSFILVFLLYFWESAIVGEVRFEYNLVTFYLLPAGGIEVN